MVSKGHGSTGASWFEENSSSYAHEPIESQSFSYSQTPRTSYTSCQCSPLTNHPPSTTPISMRGSGSETSPRSLSHACACAPDSEEEVFDELSVEEALLSIFCDSHFHSRSRSRSWSYSCSLASPSFHFLPRRDDSQEFDDLDFLPTIPSFQSTEDQDVAQLSMDHSTPAHSVRTRTFSTSRFVVAVKSHVLDANRNAREVSILKFVASIKDHCPFVQGVKIQHGFSDDDEPMFDLENYPTSLAHPEVSKQFFLSKDTIHALRSLAAELYLALSFIHGHGIVHQDVKPANIMISRDGHAVLGDFGAARFLPGSDHEQTLRTGVSTSRKIVLQPDEVVTLTPVYAAPELMQRNEDGLLEYDERVDWWSYGLTLYEVVTGRLPFQVQDDLLEDGVYDHEAHLIRDIDEHPHAFLRLLLVRDPASRLCGHQVKMHPFFDRLSGLWGRIKSLRHPPPCFCPPRLSFFSCPSFVQSGSLLEDNESGSFGNITILQPRTSYRDSSSSNESDLPEKRICVKSSERNLLSPRFAGRRMEALQIRHPAARIFDDFDESDFSRSPRSESFDFPLEEVRGAGFLSCRIENSFSMDSCCSPPQPLPSTCSIVRYHYNDGTTSFAPPILEVDATLEHAEALDNFDSSFNDSGLHLPLSESPESWDVMKGNTIRKPPVTQTNQICETFLPSQPKPLAQRINVKWTLDEEIAISLLSAGATRNQKFTKKVVKRRLSRARIMINASARAMKSMGKRMSHVFSGDK